MAHQGGVSIIQNGVRVATNGDIRLDPAPGQWQAMPKTGWQGGRCRIQHHHHNAFLSRSDEKQDWLQSHQLPRFEFHLQGDCEGEGDSIRITVDLDKPIPAEFIGKVGFNFELFPNDLFGRSWYLGETSGIFPHQANGPEVRDRAGEVQPAALATGARLSVAPETDGQRILIESKTGDLQLLDARSKRNNGWFVVRSLVAAGATKGAIEWVITPHAIPGWKYQPVIHVSQIGYHPAQKKIAIIELDRDNPSVDDVRVLRIES